MLYGVIRAAVRDGIIQAHERRRQNEEAGFTPQESDLP
ncbi:hypothetical protein ARTSIC4J27_2065 [Pseudarthrobacter siccitolerans]|uniref:Uncharacterized protein n=1 Tax=Pseudarthrobacter siccitolerans TaxID=861266 RepID=A0A024H1P9_9MICC|nr:hypothetical protein ARTSIC4J27_2065 [Pseudarthrobacter siccitolerans]